MLNNVKNVVVAIAMTVVVVIVAAQVVVVVVNKRVNNNVMKFVCFDEGAAELAELRPAVYNNVPKLLLAESDSPRVVFIIMDAGDEKPITLWALNSMR